MTFVSTLVGKFWNRRGPEEFDASKLPGKIFGLTRKVWDLEAHRRHGPIRSVRPNDGICGSDSSGFRRITNRNPSSDRTEYCLILLAIQAFEVQILRCRYAAGERRPVNMEAELQESPQAVTRQASALQAPLAELLRCIRQHPPAFVLTCARGTSAHSATFGKHLIERHLGIPVSAFAPNVTTIYKQRLKLNGQLFVTVSQSGRSDDLIESTAMAKAAGALTATIVNDADSPLARSSDIVLPMSAGPELSVAATKSFVTSLSAWLHVVAGWAALHELRASMERLADRLAAAMGLDWGMALKVLCEARSLVSIGRGPTLAIAREAALKLKETCNLHAEAFSGAEFLHGPIALVESSYPILLFVPTDEAAAGLRFLAADLCRKNASVFMADCVPQYAGCLPTLTPDHPDTDAVCLIQTFYGLVIRVAQCRGTNVDLPRHLQKITRTR
jgi:glutamine---fructose-6-phosphate transaminase (isomerizing)